MEITVLIPFSNKKPAPHIDLITVLNSGPVRVDGRVVLFTRQMNVLAFHKAILIHRVVLVYVQTSSLSVPLNFRYSKFYA